jgi:cell division ATPase FtsA
MQTVKENPIVVGLDIGTTKIAAIVGTARPVWQN